MTQMGIIRWCVMAFKHSLNRASLDNLIKRVNEAKNAALKVGFIGTKQHKGTDLTVAAIAVINEFGSQKKKIPSRPFFQNTLTKNDNYKAFISEMAFEFMNKNKSMVSLLKVLGMKIQGDIQQEITELRKPPNSKATIEKKKSSNPLIDTGEMRRNVTYKIEGNK